MNRRSVLSVMLITAGCASSPPPPDMASAEYRRESARIEAIEHFEHLKKACASSGGAVLLHRTSGGRMPPTPTEMRMAYCSTPH